MKVAVTCGGTDWRTSVFPDKERGAYLLFVKKQVRTAESLEVGDTASHRLALAPD